MAENPFATMFSNPNFKRFASEGLQDFGYGLANSTNIGNAFGAATNRMAQMQPLRDQQYARDEEEAKKEEMRQRYAQTLNSWGGEYADLAEGVLAGGIEPADAYMTAWQRRYAPQGSGQESFFGTAVPMQDAEGNIVLGQMSNQGRWQPLQGAEGYTPAPTTKQIDTGTEIVTLDVYGNEIGRTPKQNAQAGFDSSYGSTAGKAAAERAQNLSQALAQSDNMIGTIDGILNDPALDSSTGILSWMQGIPGTEQYAFGQRSLQLEGQAFLQAFESLKGGGQITEVEGNKATQAIGRLSTAQSPQAYRAALKELRDIINAAKSRAGQNATSLVPSTGIPGMPMQQQGMPSANPVVRTYNPATGRVE